MELQNVGSPLLYDTVSLLHKKLL